MRCSKIFKISQGCWTKWGWTRLSPDASSNPKILWIYDYVLLQYNVEKHGIGSTENLPSSELAAGGKVGHRRVNLSFECKNKSIN